ncbi:Hypothetical predicted protein [Olea europaea subsp. europaea]|uniref:DUF1985 domain-containing protein n=1 Tax=Olea europaea subsp. europaea TaxID=158383 RepID=A0A8S0THQ2_OLEEU|nr:Hypothetical predicted protein [Olea europaea subsp. europaea]
MDFEFLILEDAWLRAHISQRSNLKYVKIVMDPFDERQREDFRNSPLGYLADIPDIQFSAQLILQLLFRTIRTEKVNELWFNVQGHLMRFDLQVYTAVMGLRCGLFPEGDDFDRLIERKRLKERYFKSNDKLHVYATLRPTDAKAKQPYISSLMPYDDPPVPVLDDIVRTVVAPQIHSLRAESEVGRQSGGQDLEDRVRSGQSGDGETSGDDESDGESGSDREGDDSKDTDDSSTPSAAPVRSPVQGHTTNSLPVRTSTSSLTKGEVKELLLDQRILFEMRLRTVKLEIEQHVTFECIRLCEFIAAQVAPHPPTTAPHSTSAIFEPGPSGCSPQDVHGRGTDPWPTPIEMGVDTGCSQPPGTCIINERSIRPPCTNKGKLLVGTEGLPEGADIAPCPDAEHEPLPTRIDDQENGVATEPSDAVVISDAEIDGCNVTDGEGIVTTVPVPAPDVPVPVLVPEGGRVSTTRWCSARL